jgi:hypothetical protein
MSAIEALAKAQELSPLNAWLLVEWLRVTARTIHSESGALSADELQARYATLADRLQAARPSVQAFAYVIQAHAGIDPLALLDEAVEAARGNDLATAATRMLVLANVLLPHSAADQQPVNRHPLEFLLDRFRPEFYTAAQIAESSPSRRSTWHLP